MPRALGYGRERGSSGESGGAEGAGSAPPLSWEPPSRHFPPGRWHLRVKKCQSRDCAIQHCSKVKEWEETRTRWETLSAEVGVFVPGPAGDAVSGGALTACPRATGCPGGRCCRASRGVCPAHAASGSLLPWQGAARMEGKDQHKESSERQPKSLPGYRPGAAGPGESRGTAGEIVTRCSSSQHLPCAAGCRGGGEEPAHPVLRPGHVLELARPHRGRAGTSQSLCQPILRFGCCLDGEGEAFL